MDALASMVMPPVKFGARARRKWAARVALLLLPASAFAMDAPQVEGETTVSRAPAAQGGAVGYRVDRYSIAGGGGSSSGGNFSIHGTLGQHDADPLGPSVGGAYEVSGGFWGDAAAVSGNGTLFANGFESP